MEGQPEVADDYAASGAAALEQFCILSKASKGRAVVALIQQVLGNPRIFVFGELLAKPNIQALKGGEHAAALRLLEIFAYHTYGDYRREAVNDALPALTDAQRKKLRMLSIVSLARAHKTVPYKDLQELLDLNNVRGLEDLIIETVYAGLVQGKLDQHAAVFKVKYAVARDVRPEDLGALAERLEKWQAAARAAHDQLMAGAKLAAEKRAVDSRHRVEIEQRIEVVKANAAKAGNSTNDRGGGGADRGNSGAGDAMERDFDLDFDRPRRGPRGKRTRATGVPDYRPRNK